MQISSDSDTSWDDDCDVQFIPKLKKDQREAVTKMCQTQSCLVVGTA